MSEITRYALKHPYRDVIVPSKCGMMVLYSDHAAREAELRKLFAKQNDEICQILGKALSFPWFKDDQKNFPGATEEDGVCVGDQVAETMAECAAEHIATLQQQLSDQRAVIERLEGALLQIQTARRIDGLYHGGETYCGMVSRLQSLAESAIQAAKGTP